MLLALTKELLNCFVAALPFLLLFEIPIIIRCKNIKGKVPLPHLVSNLFFVWLLTIMLDLTGIPSIRLLFGYGIITDHGLIIPASEVNLIPFHYLAADIRPYLENILLFIPFGFLLPLLWERYHPFWKTVSCGFLLSLSIELSQLFNRRISDIDDLLMNTLGAFAGWLFWLLLRKCFSAICAKIKSSKEQESQIFLLRHEALFDILAAFMGMFLLYNPFL
ncbi:VanZ family protein [Caproicibacter fermentans]|uniref:VanZ family protein n=1 Tax=Caproicibacter fermentans TaxID=2576756 RepID=A0A7G8TAS5_9FIRM|nr:VanZ family protein [Caproicibacter fermentans]QNK40716.1 VanZ family protein [Caproicibacter fermentans]